MSKHNIELPLLRNEGEENEVELLLDIEFSYSPGYAGSRMEPPEPAEVEIITAKANGVVIELTDEEYEYLTDKLYEDWQEDDCDQY